MLLEKARLKLAWGLSGSEDSLKEIKRFLVDRDINLLSLSMFEIDGIPSIDEFRQYLWTLRSSSLKKIGFVSSSKSIKQLHIEFSTSGVNLPTVITFEGSMYPFLSENFISHLL